MNSTERQNPFADCVDIEHILKTSPPPQDHVLPGLLAGSAGMIVGPGGVGKTMLELQISLAIASGEVICGGLFKSDAADAPVAPKSGKVVLVTAEESLDVIWHRLHAIVSTLARNSRLRCDHKSPSDMLALWKENLHIFPMSGQPPVQLMDCGFVRTQAFSQLAAACEGARLVLLDPIRQFHQCDENDSGAMTAMVQTFQMLAKRTGAAVVGAHHTNRASANLGLGDTAGASRGSTALTDGVRWQMNLSNLTKETARQRNVTEDERTRFMMVDIAKANYLPRQRSVMLERLAGGVLALAEGDTEESGPCRRQRASTRKSLAGAKP